MLCHKNGAAVLKRLNGGLKGSNLLGNVDDLLLVKTDQRAEYRHGADLIGRSQGLYGLGCHLPDALAGYECQGIALFRDLFCDLHHVAAHDDGQLLMRALLVNVELDVGKVYNMQRDRSGIACYQLCQINHLLLCTVTGIWRSMEVNRIDLHAALCDHVACYRAINTAG